MENKNNYPEFNISIPEMPSIPEFNFSNVFIPNLISFPPIMLGTPIFIDLSGPTIDLGTPCIPINPISWSEWMSPQSAFSLKVLKSEIRLPKKEVHKGPPKKIKKNKKHK